MCSLCLCTEYEYVENGRSAYDCTGGLYARTNPNYGDALKRVLRWDTTLSNPVSLMLGCGMIQVYPVSDIISFLFGHNPRSFCHSTHTNFTTGSANFPLEGRLLPANASPRWSGHCQPPFFEMSSCGLTIAYPYQIPLSSVCPWLVSDLSFMLLCFEYGVLRRLCAMLAVLSDIDQSF